MDRVGRNESKSRRVSASLLTLKREAVSRTRGLELSVEILEIVPSAIDVPGCMWVCNDVESDMMHSVTQVVTSGICHQISVR